MRMRRREEGRYGKWNRRAQQPNTFGDNLPASHFHLPPRNDSTQRPKMEGGSEGMNIFMGKTSMLLIPNWLGNGDGSDGK